MGIQRNTVAEKMNLGQLAVNNTLDDAEILSRVSPFGYNAEKMLEGKRLVIIVEKQVNEQEAAIGTEKGASQTVNALKKRAFDTYQSLSQVCEAIYIKDNGKLAILGLTGKMPSQIPAFIKAAHILFENAQRPEIQVELANFGYNIPKLQSELEKISELEKAHQKREQTKGTKQQSTREKSAAVTQMDAWVKQYLKIAKVALKDKPELLEKLGVRVLSSKTAAQRKAPAKAAETRAAKSKRETEA